MTWIKQSNGRYRCTVCRISISIPEGIDPAKVIHKCGTKAQPAPAQPQAVKQPPSIIMLDDSAWLTILPCIHRTEQLEPSSVTCCGGGVNLYPVYGCNERARCALLTYRPGQKEVACYTCPDRAVINPTTGQPEKQPRPVPPLPPNPAAITAAGICHICQKPGAITFCRYCGHWLCSACSTNWLARGWAALKEQLGFTRPNCCGPTDTPVQ